VERNEARLPRSLGGDLEASTPNPNGLRRLRTELGRYGLVEMFFVEHGRKRVAAGEAPSTPKEARGADRRGADARECSPKPNPIDLARYPSDPTCSDLERRRGAAGFRYGGSRGASAVAPGLACRRS
jgi:hypothetical protein